ncbi:mitochondrial ribosomal protein L39 [Colletes latitarsis]|uniref:mitochondrial ribosomal protein L39 n=1 Tax=Colletes latitarsis TaxID=2605962 RepID=UPI0040366A87
MFQRCRSFCFDVLRLQTSHVQLRCSSILSKAEVKERRNQIFEKEKKRQRDLVGRIEKIEVNYKSPVDEITLVMNKYLSTPADCAKHISEGVAKVSAIALVDDFPWDMHRPLVSDCQLQLVNMKSPKNNIANVTFWRTCSFLLGAMIESAFKTDVQVHLHSFPVPHIKSGNFVYDVYLDLPDWKPTDQEMRAMSAQFVKLINLELPIERIEIAEEIALDMFQDNPFKFQQIPDIARTSDDKITLYRVGDHIDISKGPMVGNTSLIGRCTIAVVHKLPNSENIYRFQGVALPKGILLNHYAYSILENRAKKLNENMWMPQTVDDDIVESPPVEMSASN